MSDTLEQIRKDIDFYHSNAKEISVDKLLKLKTHLTTLNYYLAEQVADMKESYNNSYYIRKISISKTKNAYVNKSYAATKAESIATEEEAEKLETELNNEALANRLDLLLKQSNKIVEDITQRISVLKQEKQLSNHNE